MKKNAGVLIILLVLLLTVLAILGIKHANKSYLVEFNTDGGNVIEAVSVKNGHLVSRPSDPEKEGYIFIDWYYDGIPFDFNTQIKENIVLKAVWKEIKEDVITYVITFDTDGGNSIVKQVVEEGKTVKKPADPTKEGYTFNGWVLNDKEYNFSEIVKSNLTLKAMWKKIETKPVSTSNNNSGNTTNSSSSTKPQAKTYTVTFDTKGGTAVSSKSVVEGSAVSKPSDPTKSGYKFIGWTLNGNSYDFNSKVNSNITLVAAWKVLETFTVTFNSNGGSDVTNQTVTEGNVVSKPSDPVKEGYNFAGWTQNGNAYNFSSAVNSSITLVANYTQKNYTFSYLPVDPLFPTVDQRITVYEEGSVLNTWSINLGFTVTSTSPYANYYDLDGVSSLTVKLAGGTNVTAYKN